VKIRYQRYQEYNRSRMMKAVGFDQKKATLLFKIIPFLLHTNSPDLPGYVDDPACPFGIFGLKPLQLVDAELFNRYFPASQALRDDALSIFAEKPVIHSLKTIGSIGTIAQADRSDCDFWLSIRQSEIANHGLALLERKCQGIAEWCLKKGVEVYFFPMDIDQTRENSFDTAADEESAGSALKILLKDELFRTHILVAGKMLLWWLIPPGLSEEGYRAYVKKLVADKTINPERFIDLGYMSSIPKSEIFGASLWQMNKAYDSPFKSVIKFAYLDLLLQGTNQTLPLFSDRVKCLVTFPETMDQVAATPIDLSDVDPYLLMAREIVAFYQQETVEKKRAELIRECLFLKTLEGMASARRKPARRLHLAATIELMKHWQLLPGDFEHFSELRSWPFRELMLFGAKIHDFLIDTYSRLQADFSRYDTERSLTITQRDIAVLGRKLFTFYEKKPNKIEYIRSISREVIGQSDITIHIAQQDNDNFFCAFQGDLRHTSLADKSDHLIKREKSLPALITWLFINGIMHEKTSMHLTKNPLPVDLTDIQGLTEAMFKNFPLVHFSHIPAKNLVQPESIFRVLIVVNMYKEPVQSSKTMRSWLISYNSYGEYFVEEFATLIQLKNSMRFLLTRHFVSRWNNNLDFFIPPQREQVRIKDMLFK
jgi:adenylate cyclase class 1